MQSKHNKAEIILQILSIEVINIFDKKTSKYNHKNDWKLEIKNVKFSADTSCLKGVNLFKMKSWQKVD